MLIAVVSDTHGHEDYTREATAAISRWSVDAVLHCGDIGGPQIPPLFSSWPTHFVFGNVDHERELLRDSINNSGHHCHERFGELQLGGLSIALLHGDDSTALREAIASGRYDLVCYGHTHVARETRENGVVALNPGALYRAKPHSFAIVAIPELSVQVVALPLAGGAGEEPR